MEAVFFILLLLYQLDFVAPECNLPNCDMCDGDTCTQCSPTYFSSEYGCLHCYIACFYCHSGDYVEYFKCGDTSCGCDVYNNFPPNRTILDCTPQLQSCYKCALGYFHDHKLGSNCYKCLHSNCKCTEADNCPECIDGKYNATNFCQDTCPKNCVNCTDETLCGDCVPGKYGITCDSDCIDTCDDGLCDKMLGTCTNCPFGKYPDTNNPFGMTFCEHCPMRCAGCVNPNNCTLCDSVDYWGTACQHNCSGCEGECSKEDGCSAGCKIGYYQEFSADKNGYECQKCQSTCRTCTSWLSCQSCYSGFWGSRCQYSCTGCASDCDTNGCSSGCVSNYYRRLKQGGYQCSQCPDNGYLAVDDVGCVPCSAISGDSCAFDGCDDGASPIYDEAANVLKCVELHCPETCLSCSSEDQCDSCKANLWGELCQYTCGGCRGECFINNGCSAGCTDSLYQVYSTAKKGYECLECPQNCNSCTNGSTCDACKTNYWGANCQFSCSGCKGTCDMMTGCYDGCIYGYYQSSINGGIKCEQCSATCQNQTCNSTGGSCITGCGDSWSGPSCDTRCSPSCLACEQSNPAICKVCKDGSPGPVCETSSATVPFVSAFIYFIVFPLLFTIF